MENVSKFAHSIQTAELQRWAAPGGDDQPQPGWAVTNEPLNKVARFCAGVHGMEVIKDERSGHISKVAELLHEAGNDHVVRRARRGHL